MDVILLYTISIVAGVGLAIYVALVLRRRR